MSTSVYSGYSRATTLGGFPRKLSLTPKSSMNIHIKNHYQSKIYTTGSEVSGHVTICPQNDTRFDILQIVLLGTSKTRLDAVNIPQATCHTFLKLVMPIPESSYPVPRIFEAGMTYTIPFTFIIPATLTLNACGHQVANDSVREEHMRLPPTIGSWEKDDFAPDMNRIQYTIKARVYKDEIASGETTKVMEAGREIRVLPATPENAPLSITKHDDLYTMTKSKNLRKTILSPKSGKVTITATQPGAAMLSPDGHTITSTTVPLELQFEPASGDARPPKVTGISSKVTAVTYYSAGGINNYPNLKDWQRAFATEGRGSYSGTTSVPTGAIGDIRWSRHLTTQARRDSGYGSETLSSDSDHLVPKKKTIAAPILHTARLRVPVQLPVHKKTFVPTFHSCIASRVYVLWLTVTLASGGATANVTLGVPLQVGVEPSSTFPEAVGLPPSFEEVEELDADEYLCPRVFGVPTVDFTRTAALPGYADLEVRRRTVAAH
ncbi:hypothetical protein GGS26DRAFT_554790 [Hypomontagnella submonticulosa]|nr:hypothetical protein GGS26DRAFT_554790 [Hypomontagnella submonticulosa]